MTNNEVAHIVDDAEVLPALAPQSANPGQSRAQQLAELQAGAQFLDVAYGLADKACSTNMVAAHFRGKPQDGAIAIAYGSSLGWAWTKSLQDVYVVNGKPSIQSKEMRELLIRAGHTIEEVEVTAERVVLVGYRRGSDVPVTVEWTMDDAKQAGLLKNVNYEKFPKQMLYARATTDLAKRMAPDAMSGIGIYEDQVDIDRPAPARRPQKARGVAGVMASLGIESPAADTASAEPAPKTAKAKSSKAPKAATAAQRNELVELMGREPGLADKTEALAWLSAQLGRTELLTSTEQVTANEAAQVITFLRAEQAKDAEAQQ